MAVVVFFVPTIVNVAMGLLDDYDVDFSLCEENANINYIKAIEEEEKIEKEVEELKRQQLDVSDIDTKPPYVISSNLGMSGLPDDLKYYPLLGTDMDGEKTEWLEYDGKYLTESQMSELNSYIKKSVESVGDNWGTRVATAAYSLIYGLSEYGLRLHYELG